MYLVGWDRKEKGLVPLLVTYRYDFYVLIKIANLLSLTPSTVPVVLNLSYQCATASHTATRK